MTVQVQGLRQLDDQLQHLAGWLREPQSLHLAVAQVIIREAQPRTPRRTGHLASSQRAEGSPTAARLVAATPYAAAVHQGVPARNIRPHPWLIQTAAATMREWETAAVDTIDDELREVTGK